MTGAQPPVPVADDTDGTTDDANAALARLRATVGEAIAVPRLLAVIAAEARQNANWRAAAWLLTNVHGVSPQSVGADAAQVPSVDELAELRQLHAQARAVQR